MLNVERFVNVHVDELRGVRTHMLTEARAAVQNGIIPGGSVGKIFGDWAGQFLNDFMTDPEHVRLAIPDVLVASTQPSLLCA